MASQGFGVQRHYLGMETAWRADFKHTSTSSSPSHGQTRKMRTLGLNSEMDALPGIGHACGHNLIAIAGVAVALATKHVLIKHNLSGNVVLLGTPGKLWPPSPLLFLFLL
jgi:metal-dependent amidase/aminoacylase/carboxypeptidase family protein